MGRIQRTKDNMESNPARIVRQSLLGMLPAAAMLALAFGFQTFHLDTRLSAWIVRWTNTGDVLGVSLLGLAMAMLLSFRKPLPWCRRLQALAIHILVLALLQGGGALINEYVIKPAVAVPRPNIMLLAEDGALGMSAEQFYSTLNRQVRGAHLEEVLTDPDLNAITLSAPVRDHWIHETGYSMPSGHAFSAMLLATYFLSMGSALVKTRRRRVFGLLPMWAILVGWSRVSLMVHRPVDVVVGGLTGIVLGTLAIILAYCLLLQVPCQEC